MQFRWSGLALFTLCLLSGCHAPPKAPLTTIELPLPAVGAPQLAATEEQEAQRLLFMISSGDYQGGATQYRALRKKYGRDNYALLQQFGFTLLKAGSHSRNPEEQLLSLYGAGILNHSEALEILQRGIQSDYGEIQLAAIHFLGRIQDDRADAFLLQATSSPYFLCRLEAAYLLAQRKQPMAYAHLEALMHKLGDEARPLFPPLFAGMHDSASTALFRQMLSDNNPDVRIAALLSAAEERRDDMLPAIRMLAKYSDVSHREACAIALGTLHDESSAELLFTFTRDENVVQIRLAALKALYLLGRTSVQNEITQIAQSGNLFAITLLGEIPGSEETLFDLTHSSDLQVRTNAALALLARRDPRCLAQLSHLLIDDERDIALLPLFSVGRGLTAIKAVPSAQQNLQGNPFIPAIHLAMKEELLAQALELPEEDFLALAQTILDARQSELIPLLTHLLENLHTPQAIALLKEYEQRPTLPLIRRYCNLALFRLNEPGPWHENLQQWLASHNETALFQLRAMLPWTVRPKSHSPYELTAEETSRLLVESYQALAEKHDPATIDILLDAIVNSNPKNRSVLAGLLIYATE